MFNIKTLNNISEKGLNLLTENYDALRILISIRTEIESYFSDNELSFIGACESLSPNLTGDLNEYTCSTTEYDYRISVAATNGKAIGHKIVLLPA